MTLDVAYPGALEGADAAEDTLLHAPGGISRRRLVQGALWATPAVMIATAAPAAAASPARVGGVDLLGHRGYQNTDTLTVMTNVIYVGDGPPSPDHPVSGVNVNIVVPTNRLRAGAGSTQSSGWEYIGRTPNAPSSGFTTFVYRWNSANLSGTASTTSQLVALMPKLNTDRSAIPNVTVRANGTSNTVPVTHPARAVAIGAYGLLMIPNNLTATRDPFLTSPRYMQFVAPVRNSSNPVSANVVDLVARITVPTAAVGTGTPSATAGTWTYVSSTTSGSNTIVTFRYTPGTLAASGTNTAASFRIPMVAFYLNAPTVSIVYEGRSPTAQGAAISASASATLGL